MKHIVTTCDICGNSYHLQDSVSKKDIEKTLTIQGKTYDICIECENEVMRFIQRLKQKNANNFV